MCSYQSDMLLKADGQLLTYYVVVVLRNLNGLFYETIA